MCCYFICCLTALSCCTWCRQNVWNNVWRCWKSLCKRSDWTGRWVCRRLRRDFCWKMPNCRSLTFAESQFHLTWDLFWVVLCKSTLLLRDANVCTSSVSFVSVNLIALNLEYFFFSSLKISSISSPEEEKNSHGTWDWLSGIISTLIYFGSWDILWPFI